MPEVERIRISELPDGGDAVTIADELVIVQGGRTRRATVGDVSEALPQPPLNEMTARVIGFSTIPTNPLFGWTYDNGAAGAGATITNSVNGAVALTIDGVTLATNDVILWDDLATPAQNGLYIFTNGTSTTPAAFERHPQMDTADKFNGAVVFVGDEGTVYARTSWICLRAASRVVGTTTVRFNRMQPFPGGSLGDVQLSDGDNFTSVSGGFVRSWTRVNGSNTDYEEFGVGASGHTAMFNQRGDIGSNVFYDYVQKTGDDSFYAGTAFDPSDGSYNIFAAGELDIGSDTGSVFVNGTEFTGDGSILAAGNLKPANPDYTLGDGTLTWNECHAALLFGALIGPVKNSGGDTVLDPDGQVLSSDSTSVMHWTDTDVSLDVDIGNGGAWKIFNNGSGYFGDGTITFDDSGNLTATMLIGDGSRVTNLNGNGNMNGISFDGSSVYNLQWNNVNNVDLDFFSFNGSNIHDISWTGIDNVPMFNSGDWYMNGNLHLNGATLVTNYISDEGIGYVNFESQNGIWSNRYIENAYDFGTTSGFVDLNQNVEVYSIVLNGDTEFSLDQPPNFGQAGTMTLLITGDGASTISWAQTVSYGDAGDPGALAANVTIFSLLTVDGGTTWKCTYVGGF